MQQYNQLQGMATQELIETLWNVNKGECEIPLIYDRELIETLWNVNLCGCRLSGCAIGINRNIVECK